MTPAELLAAAREIQERPAAGTTGLWPRAAALLARQALESAIRSIWEADATTAPVAGCSGRSQLACLPAYLDESTARQIAYVWAALSRACHCHSYELAPTAAELTGWFQAIDRILDRISSQPESA
ncbi:MAG TPA: hypothetical protein VGG35_15925 [Streptosporangiaceae bacterium]|jgi:hypothetical protein